MKKNLIALVITGVAILSGTSKTNAQMVSNTSSLEFQRTLINDQDNISRRALKNFANTYGNVTNENWMQVKDGFIVRFISEGIRSNISYDKKGNWVASVKNYGEEKLVHDIRHIVKSNFYDYAIVAIQEIETIDSHGIPTYIISMESRTQIKILRIHAGDMEVWKEFNRAG
jgi:hypothetical protein